MRACLPVTGRRPQPTAGGRLWASFAVCAALVLGGAAERCLASTLDSLRSFVDAESLFIDFAVPIRSLRAARVDAALDEQGLSVDCVITTEVRKKAGFLNHTVIKNVVRRTLSYSRWYEEYVLAENAREISTHKSYYPALDRFRRFSRLRVVDLGILDPSQEYSIRLDLDLVPRLPSEKTQGRDPSFAGVGVPRDMLCRICASSDAVNGSCTQLSQFLGRGTGPGCRNAGGGFAWPVARLLHNHRCACRTRWARNGLRST